MMLARLCIAILLLSGLAARPAAATPGITRIEPPGAPRGGEIEVVIHGRELADPQELFFEEGRLEVVALEGLDDGRLKATVRVPADCPTGPHRLRIRTREGLSELRTFRVGLFSMRGESEPNDTQATAEAVTLPCTISGVVKAEDVDCFKVSLPAGGRITVAVDGVRLDQHMFDPHLDIVDARGFVVAACDDHPLLAQDAMLTATVAEAGDYVLRIRESSYGGNDNCVYLLHLGDGPVAHVAWPPAGPPGAEIDVEWHGDPAGPFRQRVVLPPAAGVAALAEVHPLRDGHVAPVPVPLRLCPHPAVVESEPNDEPPQATWTTAPAALAGRFAAADDPAGDDVDVDWYRVAAPPGSAWHVRGWARRVGSPADLVVNIHRDNDKRERITGNDDADGPDSAVQLTVPAEGSFLVRVNDHQKRGGPEFIYWIEVEPAPPEAHVAVPVGRSNSQERLVAVVPRGNRAAMLLNATRAGFGGAARVALDGLPAGVRATVPDVAAAAPATLAVFEAAAEAVPTTGLADVRVTAADDGRVLGRLRQKTDLVFGPPNNAVYRAVLSDRLPVAVVEEAPLRIELEAPAVPLVRRGSAALRVRVERAEGVTGKVRMFLPFRPPGIGAAASGEIPADRDEGTYLLNAAPDAPLGTWQIAVTALVEMDQPEDDTPQGGDKPKDKGKRKRKRSGDGGMLVSSGLVTLEVVEPVVELAAEMTAIEQGREGTIVWQVKKPGVFSGTAEARLLGLPTKVEAPELTFAASATEVTFPITVAADAPAGPHKNVFCEFRTPQGEAWVVHATAPTTLRVDRPLPPDDSDDRDGPPVEVSP
jgi:hypothetical protein